ncbi:TetR/AcrR family transcriptional regulator C-terminal domain-containing protein [Dactylosporangium sp. NPDC049742]|uniref:TetR/AcrR family transcriptional regulator n=1 Tax=Dactylosporangium sp. NPDC049742 TaxID=3154737 RepID=UPI00344749D8
MENELPSNLAVAWGLRARPGKGPRPGLTLDRIVAAGVQVAAAEGLGAVSMSRVAAELGAATMSLYRYVAAKNELLDLMVDAAVGHPPPMPPGEGWREGMLRFARTHLEILRRQPWMVRVPITSPPLTPNHVAWMDHGLAVLAETPLEEHEKLSTIMTVSGITRNWAVLTADITAAAQASGTTADEAMLTYGQLLGKLADPQRFPAIGRLLATGILDVPDETPDTDFEFGLARVLDGIQTLIERRQPCDADRPGTARAG